MQQTNLALLRKASQYEPDRPFRAWARSIAYYEVLTFRQRQRRERLVFDDELLDRVSARIMCEEEIEEADVGRRRAVLASCLDKLTRFQRSLIDRRYFKGVSVAQIARQETYTEAAISTLLYRIRKSLAECIRQEVEEVSA